MENTTIYKGNSFYGIPILIAPVLVSFVLLFPDAPLKTSQMVSIGLFWLMGIIVALVPLISRLEVGSDYVKTYIFDFCLTNVRSTEVESVQYTNLFRAGLGGGKGLIIRVIKNDKRRTYSIGERLYGRDAIAHAKRVLEGHREQ